jgi:hypothetical protein
MSTATIPNYVEPQLTIAQYLDRLQGGAPITLRACAIGPKKFLSRYGKEDTAGVAYRDGAVLGEEFILPYTYVDADGATQTKDAAHTVNTDRVRVHGVALEARLTEASDYLGTGYSPGSSTGDGPKFYIPQSDEANVVRLGYPVKVVAADDDAPTFTEWQTWYEYHRTQCLVRDTSDTNDVDEPLHGRDLEIGDIVYVKDGTTDPATGADRILRRTIKGFRGVEVPSVWGSDTEKDDREFAASTSNPAVNAVFDSSVRYKPAGTTATVTEVDSTLLNVTGATKINGLFAEEFTITCTTAATGLPNTAVVSVTSLSGKHTEHGVNVTGASDNGEHTIAITYDGDTAYTVLVDYGGAGALMARGDTVTIRVFPATEIVDPKALLETSGFTDRHYNGPKSTTYFVEVVTGSTNGLEGAVLRIYDSAGVDPLEETDALTAADTVLDVGYREIAVTLDQSTAAGLAQGGLRAGDIFYTHAVADTRSATQFDTIVLDGPAATSGAAALLADDDVLKSVEFFTAYTGEILATASSDQQAWSAGATGVTVEDGLALYVTGRDSGYEWCTFEDSKGTLHVSWIADVPPAAGEGRILVSSDDDILVAAGTADLDNPLAYGGREVFGGAQGQPIWLLNTGGDTRELFEAAFAKIEMTDKVYSLAALTEDPETKSATATHVEAMSAKDIKNFRRAYVGTDSPGEYLLASVDADGDDLYATVTQHGGGYLWVTFSGQPELTGRGLYAGDFVKVVNQDGTRDSYPIAEAPTLDNELLLSTGPANAIDPAVKVELWKADTAQNTVDYVASASRGIGSRRVANVWCDNGTKEVDGETRVIPNKYLAAEIAGLRMALPTWVGMTRTEITGVTNCPSMYERFNRTQLNQVAASGTFIVTQDAESGAVFIRHQLTTDAGNGPLYYEDSVGVNLDVISLELKTLLEKYIGKYNVTRTTLLMIDNDVRSTLNGALTPDLVYGPRLNGYEDLSVTVHPTFKDRVIVKATLFMPLPLNYIEVELFATVDLSLGTPTVAAA